jgi:hypothetical protein
MRFASLFLTTALAFAQAPLKVINPPTTLGSMHQQVADAEKRLDTKISQLGGKEHVYILGLTRGLYLTGYGAVFTQEIDLIESPRPNPFHQQMTEKEVASVHQRKVENLAALRKALRDMWADAAASLPMPDTEQVVLAVRMLYQPWEDTSGMPSQIVVKGARRGGPGGVQVEEQ